MPRAKAVPIAAIRRKVITENLPKRLNFEKPFFSLRIWKIPPAPLVRYRNSSPLTNRYNSDPRTLQPFPALMALILPRRIYFRKVGLEIFKYLIALSVVRTASFSITGIEWLLFFSFLVDLLTRCVPKWKKSSTV